MTMQNTHTASKSRVTLNNLYDKASRNWQSTIERLGYPAAYAQLMEHGLGSFDPDKALSVLDVGTGTGAFTTALLQSQREPKRIDLLEPSAKMLDAAQSHVRQKFNDVTPILGGIGSKEVSTSAYDVVLCAHVIEHIDDVAGGLKWMHRCLKPGGVLLLAVSKPHWCTALVRLRWGHSAYQPSAVTRLLTDAGFGRIDTVPFKSGPPSRTSCGFAAQISSVPSDKHSHQLVSETSRSALPVIK